jgi:hypothetical protein
MKKEKSTALVPEKKAQYGYLKSIILSFYSRNLYVDVGKRWHGLGLIYLIIMLTIFTLPMGLKTGYYFNQFFNDELIAPFKNIPNIYIQNGQVNFEKPMPYYVKDKQGQVKIIIDTTGTINGFSSAFPEMTVLITKNSILYRIPEASFTKSLTTSTSTNNVIKVNKVPLDENLTQVFNGEDWVNQAYIGSIKFFMVFITPILVMSFFFGIMLVLLLIFAFLGQVVAQSFFDLKINFFTSSRLMIVASTPMNLLLLSMLTFQLMIPYIGFLFIIILSVYYCLALFALKRESRKVAIQ